MTSVMLGHRDQEVMRAAIVLLIFNDCHSVHIFSPDGLVSSTEVVRDMNHIVEPERNG